MDQKPNTTEPGKPRRRWFQFRLRTLLIVAAIAAFAFLLAKGCVWYMAHPMLIPDGDVKP